MPTPDGAPPPDTYPVVAAPSRDGTFAAVRIVRPFLWLAAPPAGGATDASIFVRDGGGQAVTTAAIDLGGGVNVVDLRNLEPAGEHEIAHERKETLLAPKLRLRASELRRCLDCGDAAGAVAAVTLAFPQDEDAPSSS